jgi:hypothetical protein
MIPSLGAAGVGTMDQKEIAAKEEDDRKERLANQDSTRGFLQSQRIPYPPHVSFAQIVDRAIGEMNWPQDAVYRKLLDAFDRGFFGPDLHFSDMKYAGIEGSEYELQTLTKKELIDVLCSYEPDTVRDHYLAHCWVDVATANRWLDAEGVKSRFVVDPNIQSTTPKEPDAAPADIVPAAEIDARNDPPPPREYLREGAKKLSAGQVRRNNLADAYDSVGFDKLEVMPHGRRYETVKRQAKGQIPGTSVERELFTKWSQARQSAKASRR